MKKFTYSLLSIALATALTACGGGDDNKSSTQTVNHNKPDTQQTTAIGRFVDSNVQGVEVFQNGKSLGITNKMGQFEYKVNGGLLTFKLGEVTLGSTQPKPVVTPVDLTTDINEQTKIMQVLQSLDSDQNPENGITISETVIKNLNTPMNLTDTKVTPLDVIQKAIPNSHHVVPADAARAHFDKTMKEEASTNHNNDSSKTDTMVGYWKSTCLNEGSGSSITYGKITKLDNQHIRSQSVEHNYATQNCSGSYSTTTRTKSHNVTDDKGGQITIINNDQFAVQYTDHGRLMKEVYNRISESEYNKVSQEQSTHNPASHSADMFVGYWKSECIRHNNNSEIAYTHITKADEMHLKNRITNYRYNTNSCTGNYHIEHNIDIVSVSELNEVKVLSNDSFQVENEIYHRISEGEYPKN